MPLSQCLALAFDLFQWRLLLKGKVPILKALSPERWLKRGLALISNTAGDPISDLESVKIGDQLNIQMSNGSLEARVDQIQPSAPTTSS